MASGIHSGSAPRQDPPVRRASATRVDGRALVVDDTEANRYLITQTLRRAGMEVAEAATGQEALAAAALGPEVVVLDVRLPDMSGFDVCRQTCSTSHAGGWVEAFRWSGRRTTWWGCAGRSSTSSR